MNSKVKTIEIKNMKLIAINEHVNNFIKFLDVAPLTVRSYTSALKQFFSYLRNNDIKMPERKNITEFKKALTEAGRKSSTVALYLAAIKRFFAWTEAEGIYPNITAGIKSPKQDRGHKEDLRLNAGVPVLYVQGKGRVDKAEFVKITPRVAQAIRAYLQARGSVGGNAPLFASCSRRNYGQRLTTRSISSICKKAMITAGLISSRLTAHSLRHSSITLALLAGQSLQVVQAFARHANMSTTLVYAHDVDRLNSQCESLIEHAIFL